ncbi:hypothetical protein ACRS81_12510 [Stutzerimonas stutzeri]|uniref:hypothetical protein n=1 Tax=Stutzerimonas stutzeri TaxID=316 RepID=UPI003EE41D96
MKTTEKKEQRKLTVLLDEDLEQRLNAERERVEKATGYRPALTHVATRAMRAGFDQQQA